MLINNNGFLVVVMDDGDPVVVNVVLLEIDETVVKNKSVFVGSKKGSIVSASGFNWPAKCFCCWGNSVRSLVSADSDVSGEASDDDGSGGQYEEIALPAFTNRLEFISHSSSTNTETITHSRKSFRIKQANFDFAIIMIQCKCISCVSYTLFLILID